MRTANKECGCMVQSRTGKRIVESEAAIAGTIAAGTGPTANHTAANMPVYRKSHNFPATKAVGLSPHATFDACRNRQGVTGISLSDSQRNYNAAHLDALPSNFTLNDLTATATCLQVVSNTE
jgi:hypothetical protein